MKKRVSIDAGIKKWGEVGTSQMENVRAVLIRNLP